MKFEAASLLVVDDNEMNRNMLSRRLEKKGYTVTIAEGGQQTLDLIEQNTFDLVLLDVMMPQMDGWEILSTLKADPTTADIPVVMLTARTREADQIRGWRAGASDYIIKPFNPEALIPSVRAAIDRQNVDGHRRERLDMLRFTQKLLSDKAGDREGTVA